MRSRGVWRVSMLCVGIWLASRSAAAVNVQIDYTYDASNFFGNGNPQGAAAGAQAKAALDAAASFYSVILTDTFDAITVPAPYHSTAPGSTGVFSWSWTETFQHPTSNAPVSLTNPVVGSDQYIVYAGARSLFGSTTGQGAPGDYSSSGTVSGTNSFTANDVTNINAIDASFNQAIATRGETSGFARWGGTITFDNDGSTSWFYNHLAAPSGSATDFYSVAIHELAHTLGFGELGSSAPWASFISGSSFTGPSSTAQNGGNPVPLAPGLAHWISGTTSVVYNTSIAQEAAMDPDLQNGTRKFLTDLDAAGLRDIGWSLGPVPEPSSAMLLMTAGLVALFARCRRRS